ncbi:MAG: hypothetical protein KC646_00120 [Candidatus Cloacimonetes bacterium]|nr:hypothetical protein [Candidatus Cloacimonadota bacterium]
MPITLEDQQIIFSEISKQLEDALIHSKITEGHFNDKNVPRACAHAFALDGHLVKIKQLLDKAKLNHSTQAKV